jgi:hypothetical protein
MALKRVRVDDRAVLVIAAVAGVAAALSDLSPTGAQPFDAIVVVASVGFVTWAAAAAPWWAPTLLAGLGAVLTTDPVVIAVGAAACVLGLWVGTRRQDLSTVRAGLCGVGLNVLCRSDYSELFGVTAAIGIGLAGLMVVSGVRRRHRRVQRWVLRATAVTGGLVVLAGVGLGVAAAAARSEASQGQSLFAVGIDHLRDGKYVEAARSFDASAKAFEAATTAVNRPWALPADLVPVAAQNRRAVADVAAASQRVSTELANTSLFIESDFMRVSAGRLDLDALGEVSEPVLAAYQALTDLRAVIDDVSSPWLLSTVDRRLDRARIEFDENIDQFATGVLALRLAPQLLGGEGDRHYFVAFTTPAEARGLGGFMGNYAELTASDGQLSLTGFGRTRDLNDAGDAGRRVTGPEDWLARWGRYGFTNTPDGSTGEVPWSNVTMSPQFPSTAQVIAELYPQSGGSQVDGVLAMDPYVLQALIGFTGPITIEGTDQRLNEDNVIQFLLFDQYLIDDTADRIDLLAEVAEQTLDELLDGALPGPTVLANELRPLADAGRLVAWARDPAEQELFEVLGMSGAFPQLGSADGFEVIVNNAGANKLDVYLDRTIEYRALFDPVTRALTGTIEVVFTNTAPTSGLPSGVIDNYVGDPVGTNRTLVSFYTAVPFVGATLEGESIELELGREAGWHTSTTQLVIPSGESRTLSLTVAGSLPTDTDETDGGGGGEDPSYELVVRSQPLSADAVYDIDVGDTNGLPLVVFTGPAGGIERLEWPAPVSVAR